MHTNNTQVVNLTSEIKQLYIPNQKTTNLLHAKPQTDNFIHPNPSFLQEGLFWKEFITKEMTIVHNRSQQCSRWATDNSNLCLALLLNNWVCWNPTLSLHCQAVIPSTGTQPEHSRSHVHLWGDSLNTAALYRAPQCICSLVLHRGWWVSPDLQSSAWAQRGRRRT